MELASNDCQDGQLLHERRGKLATAFTPGQQTIHEHLHPPGHIFHIQATLRDEWVGNKALSASFKRHLSPMSPGKGTRKATVTSLLDTMQFKLSTFLIVVASVMMLAVAQPVESAPEAPEAPAEDVSDIFFIHLSWVALNKKSLVPGGDVIGLLTMELHNQLKLLPHPRQM
ncbi:hypothetical protein E1B28_008082 [Marasmius oreades]|uniref:Uncharacterized protein n=1 Tax=Marasmius oreades TaxID=181124 RepID=A0A9P7S2Z9_9AGAR|nr:uncharacterized protein E1B28_012969 [Marasmius oreades]XP_043010954.1 uncharacterized protein E1B28_008082 [Marasmius oreades]KAG7086991.1 hypothetical protein E1B28_012969 [Marasmius oreades]KAG7094484.1 hypothetical protein E1B28_008082 [Marasmius oreades]